MSKRFPDKLTVKPWLFCANSDELKVNRRANEYNSSKIDDSRRETM